MTAARWSDGAAGPLMTTPGGNARGGDWQDRALCPQVDPDLWYPPNGGTSTANNASAKAVCRRCPVISECLEYALEMEARADIPLRHGIWGATTPADRRRIAAARERTAA